MMAQERNIAARADAAAKADTAARQMSQAGLMLAAGRRKLERKYSGEDRWKEKKK